MSIIGNVITIGAPASSNRNLLDNAWFTVNQRGQSSYSGVGYTVDRWYNYNNTNINVYSDYVTISNSSIFMQKMEPSINLVGKTVTLSVMMSDGTVYSGSFTVANAIDNRVNTPFGALTLYNNPNVSNNMQIVTDADNTASVRAVKLELGTVSTLDKDVAPNYTEELLKCQRYFYKIAGQGSQKCIGYAIADGTTACCFEMFVPTEMRATPTVTTTGTFLMSQNNWGVSFSYIGVETHNHKYFRLIFTGSGLSAGVVRELICQVEGSSISFSADL